MDESPLTAKQLRARKLSGDLETGFDVTCVVGRVEYDANGDMSPHKAAFIIIAEQDMPGTYTFPMSVGGTCSVTVDYENMPRGPEDA